MFFSVFVFLKYLLEILNAFEEGRSFLKRDVSMCSFYPTTLCVEDVMSFIFSKVCYTSKY